MPEEKPSKAPWTRCPGCKDRVFNDKLDIGIHRGHCPADLQRSLQKLKRQFDELKGDVEKLSSDIAEAPAIDLDEIAPWTGDPVDENPDAIDWDAPAEADAVDAFADEDDDEDEVEAVAPLPFR